MHYVYFFGMENHAVREDFAECKIEGAHLPRHFTAEE
jgi:hypothetical protein